MSDNKHKERILLTGTTGYVGGRLAPRLLESGYTVRCLVRDPTRLHGRSWFEQVEVATGDALNLESIKAAMQNISTAYYLIHGFKGGKMDALRDLQAARNFARSAEEAGVKRIIYLGELVDPATELSPYLRSRHETGYILRQGGVPVTEFRAGMIIGAGSVLFEMIRYLAELQPVFICPSWFFSLAQPISIHDVLDYLLAALDTPASTGKLIEIGGSDRLTYADMLLRYSHLRGFKRLLIPTPFYAPRLSAYWVHMVTPIHWRTVLPLIEGLHLEAIVTDENAQNIFPHIKPLGFDDAVRMALEHVEQGTVETSWSDALVTTTGDVRSYEFKLESGMMMEKRRLLLDLPPDPVYRAFTGLGGERGWLYMDWAWEIRGWLDKLVGGVGLRRGRRDPNDIRPGEALDFWRVESLVPGRCMRLRAEMKVPGGAWLEFQAIPQAGGKTLLTQDAYFAPRGLLGYLYWYAMWPFHRFIFDGMIRALAARAREIAAKA
jgi:uncharacterized protein YbjT (DUF2867 family)